MPRNRKPQPISKSIVCSECGLPWDKHGGENPTLMECVRLLKAELAKWPNYQVFGTGSNVSYPSFLGATTTS